MKILLWLDDYRNPFLDIEKKVPKLGTSVVPYVIHWVRNYDEFTMWILLNGLPEIISFDHDLADEHYTPKKFWNDYQLSKEYQDTQNYTEKTGFDCAKWLVNYCMDNNQSLPFFRVHSANPVGADNIIYYLNNFLKN